MPRNGVLREFFGEKYFFLQNITFIHTFAPLDSLAQQVEHIPFKDGVLGSNPRRITKDGATLGSLLSFVISRFAPCLPLLLMVPLGNQSSAEALPSAALN